MNEELKFTGQQIWILETSLFSFLEKLSFRYEIKSILSHRETGLEISYSRDRKLKEYCKKKAVEWLEFQNNGVIRGLKNRKNWSKKWISFMEQPILNLDIKKIPGKPSDLDPYYLSNPYQASEEIKNPNPQFQVGGERRAWQYLVSFLDNRVQDYTRYISKPELSRKSCSRLSPYISWGNLSIRQVYQFSVQKKGSPNSFNLENFLSRLRWHCHFIQKLETESKIEYQNLNSAFDTIRTDWKSLYFEAWTEGKTGFPLIDASMRAVKETGYLNFRMRSLLVSFLTHHLWLDWRPGAWFLARQFLDYEPGIHFSQFQMQAGTTGINTIRIYNPVKQSLDHDPEAIFIHKWIPELEKVPLSLVHEPWKMTKIEQELYQCRLGLDYPMPIIDLDKTGKFAREKLWSIKKSKEAKEENLNILNRLTHRKSTEESDFKIPKK